MLGFVCQKISEGSVVAIKGIGGFLLVCDATNDLTVSTLRKRKFRPSKPLALLYPDVTSVKRDFKISKSELQELQGLESPIVLLKPRDSKKAAKLLESVAPGLDRIGVMLPYAPIIMLVARELNRPLVATSGNRKGSPIIFQNNEAAKGLIGIADYLLANNRDIKVPQDDSVVKHSSAHSQRVLIRRSRGYAPAMIQKAISASFEKEVLSMGALLKSSFCLWKDGRCHVSQYMGDTLALDAQISYKHTLDHFMNLLQFKPNIVVVDKHPAYFSTLLGKEISSQYETEIVSIQHHEAHFWSALAENDLLCSQEKILGVIFDGTGMGSDGAVWGGEFFIYENSLITRVEHFRHFPHILGDKMALEPRISALALTYFTVGLNKYSQRHFSKTEIDFYKKVLESSSLCTSSVGRIFDAVASLLNLCQISTYEGEAAMYLEVAATKFAHLHPDKMLHYNFEMSSDGGVIYDQMLVEIIRDLDAGVEVGKIAFRFHQTIVNIIQSVAQSKGVHAIAFSGGVFQNCLLLDLIIEQLGGEFSLYFHRALSPNDENISYGQLVGYYMDSNRLQKQPKADKMKIEI